MRLSNWIVPLTLAVTVSAAMAAEVEGPETVREFHFQKVKSATIKYLLFQPKGYTTSSKSWPLIVFLHGAGERGTDVSKVATHGPPRLVKENLDFPFLLVSPQCPDGEIWDDDVVLGLLDDIVRSYKVDARRVYLTGLSMGGYGTWSLGLTHPERFAAIVPICGGGNLIPVILAEGKRGDALKSLGIWAFHGGKDTTVPVDESQRLFEALKKFGVQDLKLTVYPDAGHDSWTEAYKNPALYEWLLGHERKL
jgi:predicted peptidase